MSKHTDDIQDMFPLLKNYCHSIAGSPWEAEDLMQETFIRWYTFVSNKEKKPPLSKALLYRMASHTWIDQYRKKKIKELSLEEHHVFHTAEPTDRFEVEHAIKQLLQHLPLRQSIVFLLHDVFRYKANEIATLFQTSEGAIKATLHRARRTLKQGSLSEQDHIEKSEDRPAMEQEEIIQLMVEATVLQKPLKLQPLITKLTSTAIEPPTNIYSLCA